MQRTDFIVFLFGLCLSADLDAQEPPHGPHDGALVGEALLVQHVRQGEPLVRSPASGVRPPDPFPHRLISFGFDRLSS